MTRPLATLALFGALFVTACEMAFAGHCGVTLSLDAIAFDAAAEDVDAFKRDAEEQLAGRMKDLAQMTDTDLAVRPSGEASRTVQTSSGPVDTSAIVGWGVDADPENDPTYPYRDRSKDDHSGEWDRPTQQEPQVELLVRSQERGRAQGPAEQHGDFAGYGDARRLQDHQHDHGVVAVVADDVGHESLEGFKHGWPAYHPGRRAPRLKWERRPGVGAEPPLSVVLPL